jgi:hypothetical protein
MTMIEDPEALKKRRNEIREELASIGDLRPGSLVSRYRKCGKPNCHCAEEEGGGHGPSWSLTRKVDGKTVTKIIPPGAVSQTQEQIAECRRLRNLTGELVEVSERLCDVLLSDPGTISDDAAKKGASEKPSRRKSSRRSKGS